MGLWLEEQVVSGHITSPSLANLRESLVVLGIDLIVAVQHTLYWLDHGSEKVHIQRSYSVPGMMMHGSL